MYDLLRAARKRDRDGLALTGTPFCSLRRKRILIIFYNFIHNFTLHYVLWNNFVPVSYLQYTHHAMAFEIHVKRKNVDSQRIDLMLNCKRRDLMLFLNIEESPLFEW